jgi:hypothetical protein
VKVLLALCLLFTSCAHRQVPVGVPVDRGTYIYIKVGELYHVAAVNQVELRRALAEIGCGRDLHCTVEPAGSLFIVEVQ